MNREEECRQKREDFKTTRNLLTSNSFLQSQCGPFSTMPFSRKHIIKYNKSNTIALREDGFINLSGIQFVHLTNAGIRKDEISIVSKLIESLKTG